MWTAGSFAEYAEPHASVVSQCLTQSKSVCLQDAFQLLHQAQTTEDVLFKAAQPASAQLSQVPLAPCLLTRTPTSITLTHRPFRLKTNKKAAFFAVFAKSFGAGVALGMNSTSMELEGTGVQQPLGTRVTVSGQTTKTCLMHAKPSAAND